MKTSVGFNTTNVLGSSSPINLPNAQYIMCCWAWAPAAIDNGTVWNIADSPTGTDGAKGAIYLNGLFGVTQIKYEEVFSGVVVSDARHSDAPGNWYFLAVSSQPEGAVFRSTLYYKRAGQQLRYVVATFTQSDFTATLISWGSKRNAINTSPLNGGFVANPMLWSGVNISMGDLERQSESDTPVQTQGLIGWWPLLDTGDLRDRSNVGNNLTATGTLIRGCGVDHRGIHRLAREYYDVGLSVSAPAVTDLGNTMFHGCNF